MGRSPCCDKMGLKKGPWTPEEDQKLIAYIEQHGHGSWRALPKLAGLLRCGKSCRLRWTNYLRPDIKRGKFSSEEEQTVIQLHAILGNRWSAIASHLPGRTDNEIKNYWNTHLKKRLLKMGIDPVTHKPKSEILDIRNAKTLHSSSLSHMAQWESARLEAEARLAKRSKLATTHAKLAELRHENNSTDDAFMRTLSIANTMLPHFQTSCRVGLSNFLYSWEQSLQGQSSNMFKLGATLSPRSTLCSVDCSQLQSSLKRNSSKVLMVGQKQEAERKPESKAVVKTEECEYSLSKVVAEEELMDNAFSSVLEATRSCDSEEGTTISGLTHKMSNLSTLLHDTHMVSDHESTCTTKKHTCLPSFNEGFPAELLMDIVEQSSTDTASTSRMNEATITSWSDQNKSELNGDDWSNLLKFVAPLTCLQSTTLAQG